MFEKTGLNNYVTDRKSFDLLLGQPRYLLHFVQPNCSYPCSQQPDASLFHVYILYSELTEHYSTC
jgi:hypothetical protein